MNINSVLQVFIRTVGVLTGSFAIILLSRSLPLSDFGQISTLLTVVALVTALSDLGMQSTVIREIASSKLSNTDVVASFFVARFFLGILGFIAGIFIVVAIGGSNIDMFSAICILGSLLASFFVSLQVIPIAKRDIPKQNYILLVQSSVWPILVGCVYLLRFDLRGYSVAFLLSALISAVYTAVVVKWTPKFNIRNQVSAAVRLIRLSAPLAVAGIFVALYFRVASLATYAWLGPVSSAQFNAASRIFEVMQVVPAGLLAGYLPTLSKIATKEDPSGFKVLWLNYFHIVFLSSAFVAQIGFNFSDEIIVTLFGDKYVNSSEILQVLALAFVPVSIGWLVSPVLIAFKKLRQYLLSSAAGLLVSLIAVWPLLQSFQNIGAAYVVLLVESAVAITLLLMLCRSTLFRTAILGIRVLPLLGTLISTQLAQSVTFFAVDSVLNAVVQMALSSVVLLLGITYIYRTGSGKNSLHEGQN